ncbi:MAG: hypothetical protein LH629_15735, partial [Ignavibacteria bacterium]|nr:hypothetical protein [Ignavibacteria bacterium]
MSDLKKTEYFRFLFRKTLNNLTRYELSHSDKKLINNLFNRLSGSENILKDLFILSHVKELNNMGRYFIFILKKIEDNVINFDNFTQNIETDSYFIEEEILQYFSNPEIRQIQDYSFPEEESEENTGFDNYNAEKFNNSGIETDYPENENDYPDKDSGNSEDNNLDEDIFKAKDESEFL